VQAHVLVWALVAGPRRKKSGDDGRDSGATLPEYALIAALFVLVLFGAVKLMESRSKDTFVDQANGLKSIPAGAGGSGATTTTVPPPNVTTTCSTTNNNCAFVATNVPQPFFWQTEDTDNADPSDRSGATEKNHLSWNKNFNAGTWSVYLVAGKDEKSAGADLITINLTCTTVGKATTCTATTS